MFEELKAILTKKNCQEFSEKTENRIESALPIFEELVLNSQFVVQSGKMVDTGWGTKGPNQHPTRKARRIILLLKCLIKNIGILALQPRAQYCTSPDDNCSRRTSLQHPRDFNGQPQKKTFFKPPKILLR